VGSPAARSRAGLASSTLWDDDRPQPLKARWDPLAAKDARPPARAQPQRIPKRRSWLGRFFHHYGWRAYAVPLLAALTVLVVLQIARGTTDPTTSDGSSGPPTGPGPAAQTNASAAGAGATTVQVTVTPTSDPTTVTVQQAITTTIDNRPTTIFRSLAPSSPDPKGAFGNVSAGVLPAGAPFARTGEGTWHVVPGASRPVGVGKAHLTYTIEVEDGIENANDDQAFATSVVQTLSDAHSWIGGGKFTLQRIDKGTPSFRISLTSEMTVRQAQYCGWEIQLEASCFNHAVGRVMINDARWTRGAVSFNGDLTAYRTYAINHEVGHALGFHHEPCGQNGGLAPVMMQQSWSTSDNDLARLDPHGPVKADGKVCTANPFPYPHGGPASAAIAEASESGAAKPPAASTSTAG
jgi:hypothetical protein